MSQLSVLELYCLKETKKYSVIPPEHEDFHHYILSSYIDNKLTYDEAFQQLTKNNITTMAIDFANEVFQSVKKPISVKKSSKSWTQQEDTRLLMGVHLFGLQEWAKIVHYVGTNRSRAQCVQRWERTLDPTISKDPWTYEEEAILEEAVKKWGPTNWSKIAKELGTRTDVQCRYHYKNIMNGTSMKAIRCQEMKRNEMMRRQQMRSSPHDGANDGFVNSSSNRCSGGDSINNFNNLHSYYAPQEMNESYYEPQQKVPNVTLNREVPKIELNGNENQFDFIDQLFSETYVDFFDNCF